MLSLELENKMINVLDEFTKWKTLTQEFLPDGQEKATLIGRYYYNHDGQLCGASIPIIYDGTDEDFLKKYKEYIDNWDKNKYIDYYMKTFNTDKKQAEVFANRTYRLIHSIDEEEEYY